MKKKLDYFYLRGGIVLVLWGGWLILSGDRIGYLPLFAGLFGILWDVIKIVKKRFKS